MKLFSAKIRETNPTLSYYCSTFLTEIIVIADNIEEATKKVEKRIEEIKSERIKDKEKDDERERRERERYEETLVYDLYSRSEFHIETIDEYPTGIMEIYYTGTG
jgi:hypothetical protein